MLGQAQDNARCRLYVRVCNVTELTCHDYDRLMSACQGFFPLVKVGSNHDHFFQLVF